VALIVGKGDVSLLLFIDKSVFSVSRWVSRRLKKWGQLPPKSVLFDVPEVGTIPTFNWPCCAHRFIAMFVAPVILFPLIW
jgi:hypothetical protein